jgi:hypothetical protein
MSEFYDPLSESTMDDDYVPKWHVLGENENIIPRTEPEPLSDDALVNQKLHRYAEESRGKQDILSDLGRDLLG